MFSPVTALRFGDAFRPLKIHAELAQEATAEQDHRFLG